MVDLGENGSIEYLRLIEDNKGRDNMNSNIDISIPDILNYIVIKIYVLFFLLLVLWLISFAPGM